MGRNITLPERFVKSGSDPETKKVKISAPGKIATDLANMTRKKANINLIAFRRTRSFWNNLITTG